MDFNKLPLARTESDENTPVVGQLAHIGYDCGAQGHDNVPRCNDSEEEGSRGTEMPRQLRVWTQHMWAWRLDAAMHRGRRNPRPKTAAGVKQIATGKKRSATEQMSELSETKTMPYNRALGNWQLVGAKLGGHWWERPQKSLHRNDLTFFNPLEGSALQQCSGFPPVVAVHPSRHDTKTVCARARVCVCECANPT